MAYKIAIASSDGLHIDETFGAAKEFLIYEVTDETYVKSEVRKTVEVSSTAGEAVLLSTGAGLQEKEGNVAGCKGSACNPGSEADCSGSGCSGNRGGCAGGGDVSGKVELISDCRCIVCKKIGFHIQKQLERKAITSFDVSCTVEEALQKITSYFYKVDKHQSPRKISAEKYNT